MPLIFSLSNWYDRSIVIGLWFNIASRLENEDAKELEW
jgi:hypothetical protein